jgi:hypothetical protein
MRECNARRRAALGAGAPGVPVRDDGLFRRIEAVRRLLPRELLGDPPVGRSALDRKRGTYVS